MHAHFFSRAEDLDLLITLFCQPLFLCTLLPHALESGVREREERRALSRMSAKKPKPNTGNPWGKVSVMGVDIVDEWVYRVGIAGDSSLVVYLGWRRRASCPMYTCASTTYQRGRRSDFAVSASDFSGLPLPSISLFRRYSCSLR